MAHNVLVTFDIDGTLMICGQGGLYHRGAFRLAIKEMCGVDKAVEDFLDCPLAGVSDSYIVECAVRKIHNTTEVDEKWIQDFKSRTEEIYVNTFDGILDLMPGVVTSLQALSKMPNVTLGICSGNLPRIGRKKLECAGLSGFFKDGIFGWGFTADRKDMLREAIRQAETLKGCRFDRIIHVGDAPQDVNAAIANGAIGVAVRTSRHAFREFPQPCFDLENLEVKQAEFLRIVQSGNME